MAERKTSSTDSEEKVVKKPSTQRKTTSSTSKTTESKASATPKTASAPKTTARAKTTAVKQDSTTKSATMATAKTSSTRTKSTTATSAGTNTSATSSARVRASSSSNNELDELKAARARKKAEEKLNAFSAGEVTRGLKTSVRERASVSDKDYVAPPVETKEKTDKKPLSPTKSTKEKEKAPPKKEKVKKEKVEQTEDVVDVIASTASVGRSRRNKLIIVVLIVLIAGVWAFNLFARIMKPEEIKYNCHLYTSGNKTSVTDVMLGGKEIDEWIIDKGIGPRAEYKDVLTVKIKEQGSYDIKFRIEVFKNKERIEKFGVVNTSTIFQQTIIEDEEWFETTNISGKQTITLMTGITFFDVDSSAEVFGLNSDNLKLNIYVDISQSA